MKTKYNKDDLFRLSINEGKKIDEIAKIYNVSHSTITRWLKECHIPSKYAVGDDYEILTGQYIEEIHDYNIMYDLYINQCKSIQDIANMFSTNHYNVRKNLLKLGIDIREPNLTRWGKEKRKNKNCGLEKDVLYDLYITKGINITEIAKMYNIYEKEVRRKLKEYNIKKIERKKDIIILKNLLAELKKCSLINFFNKKVAQFADF